VSSKPIRHDEAVADRRLDPRSGAAIVDPQRCRYDERMRGASAVQTSGAAN